MIRRKFLAGAGIILTGSVAGCLDNAAAPEDGGPSNNPGETGDDNEKDDANCSGNEDSDADDLSIDGRLHNETSDTQTFELTVLNDDGDVITEGEEDVDAATTKRIPAVGRPGGTQTFEVAVNDMETSKTLDLDVESSEDGLDGFVDVSYTESDGIGIWFTPMGENGDGDEDSVPELTDYVVSDCAVTPDVERNSDMDSWEIFVASRGAADGYFSNVDESEDEQVRAFIDETDFEAGDRLLYVQSWAPQTCYELVLETDPYVAENGTPVVETVLNRTASSDEPCGDAMTSVDLMVRLSFDLTAGSTDVIKTVVSEGSNDVEELLLEAKR